MLKSARRTKEPKDPEGRMPLAEHLRELRNRLMKSVLAVLVVTVVAAFFYKDIIAFLTGPVLQVVGCKEGGVGSARNGQPCAVMTVDGMLAPFSLALKASLTVGVVGATPVWLYQLWGFMAPGLHRHEKKYARWFVGTGVPLFFAGAYLAYMILPQTADILIDFTPDNAQNLYRVDDYLDVVTRMVIVFGLAFELPLLLVLLNFTGVLSAKRLAGWWRGMVLGITLFSAFATPTGDPLTMLTLAAPIVGLYFLSLGVCLLNDRRRERANPDAGLSDDEASELDLTPEAVGAIEPVSAPKALPEQASSEENRGDGGGRRTNGFDDVT